VSEVIAALERVVARVKHHVDAGDSPHQILHTVSQIRNEARAGSDATLARQAVADRQRRDAAAAAVVNDEADGGTAASSAEVTVTHAPAGVTVSPEPAAAQPARSPRKPAGKKTT
jgi:hypothetical protein